jgi:twitching motility protein PilI
MPECILGLINQRSQVIWVVDLAQMLGLEPINREEPNYQIAIARVENIPLGLVIRQVEEVMRLNPEEIDSSVKNVRPSLIPYLKGCVLQEQKILLVLNTKAIINSPIWENVSN